VLSRLSSLALLLIASLLTGAMTGLVGAAFRYLLFQADFWRDELIRHAYAFGAQGAAMTVSAVALCAALARWMVVRFAPEASGSGVPRVEAVMRDEAKPVGARVIPVKFLGGLTAIGSGLALGREGPTVQMGAALGAIWARLFLADPADQKTVNAAGAGAGLATAFNAPVGGAVFVFEELRPGFSNRIVTATLVAGVAAIMVMRGLLGDQQDFDAGLPDAPPISRLGLFVALGAALGAGGACYNALTTAFTDLSNWLRRIPAPLRAAAVGAAMGAVAWSWPVLAGGGDALTQNLLYGRYLMTEIALIFTARFLIGPFCYAAGTPGGLFAPILAVGAAFGGLFGEAAALHLPGANVSVTTFVVCGMAAMFAATVRAPLTGVALAVEMTGRADLILAMLTASLTAALTAGALGSAPVYDSLRRRMLAREAEDAGQRGGPAAPGVSYAAAPRTSRSAP
jgi:CIC family chloride channel protein